MGPFISTMEATQTITISLVLPMVGQLLIKTTNPSSKVMLLDYGDDPTNATQIKMKVSTRYSLSINNAASKPLFAQGSELMTMATKVRRTLFEDVKRRFIDNERDGHLEDLLVSTILDPRFKLMNFEGGI